ncbi:MAG: nuclear transport factor 2 family protein [Bdellovibrionales bacterium]|jgi:hypothetical protein
MATVKKNTAKPQKTATAKAAPRPPAKTGAGSKKSAVPAQKKSVVAPSSAKGSSSPVMRPVASPATARLPATMQAVVDKNEIGEVIYRFARGLDRIDETQLRSVFHHDATIDLGPGMFQGTSNDYIHWVVGVMGQVRSSHHLIGNILPMLEGDVALVESYATAHFRMDKPTGREDVFMGSRYLDRFERRPSGAAGVWKIMHRKQVLDWVRTEAVADIFYHQNPDALWSYRTKTDPSYQMAQFPGSQSGSKLPAFLGRRYETKSVKF